MSRLRPVNSPRGKDWNPKYPDFATDSRKVPAGDFNPDADAEQSEAWVIAPEDSHVHSLRYADARQSRLLRMGGKSILLVRFKPQGSRPASEYRYFFTDHERGREVFLAVANAESPWEVGYQELVLGKVPYEQSRIGESLS